MRKTLFAAVCMAVAGCLAAADAAPYSFTRQRLFPGFDGKFCKIQPAVAADGRGTAMLTFQKLLLTGMDVFYGLYISKSVDGGATWSEPAVQDVLADTHENGFRVARYANVRYSAGKGRWYAIGMAQLYKDDKVPFQKCVDGRPYGTPIYVSVDAAKGAFTGYKELPFPFEYEMALPFGQALDLDDGDVLVPFYFRPPGAGMKSQCVTVRYRFDGDGLKVVEAGTPVVRNDLRRGVGEPSLARFGGKVYMTVRSDEAGMWCESDDGLRFSAPRDWTWTDGIRIGNRNTQQHWVACAGGLYLAYTREDRTNGHVFRNRAPIFLSRFDPSRGGLVRDTEFPIVPELGARLGNFCVADSPSGPWLVTAEWMQPAGCERYGSDNSIWLVKFREKAAPAVSGARRVTSGPHEHLLANYFGINAWSPDFRKLVALETDLNGRLPEVGDACSIGLVDVATGVFEPFAKTACWNFQEAAMAHWLPSGEILYNDLRGGKFVTVVRNLASGGERVVPFPTSAVSPDGRTIVSLNYARLRLTRPDYGYPGDGQDAREGVQWPEDDGLWIVDLATGKARLIVSVASCRDRMPRIESKKGLAYFCHTTFSRDGSKIFWLARTVEDYDKASRKGDVGRKTVAFTCNADGTDVRRSFPDGWDGSHFNWKDGSTICVTAKFGARKWSHVEYTVGDESGAHILGGGALDWDGHCTYSPDGKWLSSEGYRDAMNNRHWKLLRLADGAVFDLGSFFVPEAYRTSHWRCDLHARWRADGRQLAFNSAHEGSRQIYVRDVAADGKAGN